MWWFFRVSHPYMVQDTPGDRPKLDHQDILEEKQTMTNHAHDVLPRCRYIMEIWRAGIMAEARQTL